MDALVAKRPRLMRRKIVDELVRLIIQDPAPSQIGRQKQIETMVRALYKDEYGKECTYSSLIPG